MDAGMAIAQDHGGGKAVSLSDYGFYEARLLGVVAEGGAHFADSDVDAVLDIEENVLAPETLGNLVAGDQLTVPLEQEDEQLHGEFFHAQDIVASLEPVAGLIECVIAELELLGRKSPGALARVAAIMPQYRARINRSSYLQLYPNFISS